MSDTQQTFHLTGFVEADLGTNCIDVIGSEGEGLEDALRTLFLGKEVHVVVTEHTRRCLPHDMPKRE